MKIQILNGVIAAYSEDGARDDAPGYNEISKLWNIRKNLVSEGIEHEMMFGWKKGKKILVALCIPNNELSMVSWIESHPAEEE